MEQSDEAYLFDAIEKGDYNSVYSLIETRKVNPNSILTRIVTQKETQDYTALYLAASLGKARICRLLLSKGAHPFHKMVFGMYPIHISADRGWLEVLKVLLEVPESVNKQDDNGDTPLHLSALRGHGDCVIELVSAGADLSLVNDSGRTPLEEAQKSQKTNIVNYLTRQTILSKRANKAVNRTLSDHCGFGAVLKSKTRKSFMKEKSKSCDVHEGDDHSSFTQSLPVTAHREVKVPITIVADTYVRPADTQFTTTCVNSSTSRIVHEETRKPRPKSFVAVGHAPDYTSFARPPAYKPKHLTALEVPELALNTSLTSTREENEVVAGSVSQGELSRKVTSLASCLWPTSSSLNELDQTGSCLEKKTGTREGHHVYLLSASVDLMVQAAASFNMTAKEARSLYGVASPSTNGRTSDESVKLTKGWDYFVPRENPVRVVEKEGTETAYIRIQIKPECSLNIPSGRAVLKIVAEEQGVHDLNMIVNHHGNHHGNRTSNLSQRFEHPHICQVYTSYHGNMEGFRQHLDHLQMASFSQCQRARFSLLQDHANTLGGLVEERRHIFPEPPYGMSEATILTMMFQLFLTCVFLENNNCTGINITLDDVCVSDGLVFLNLQEALERSNRLDIHSCYHGNDLCTNISKLIHCLLVPQSDKEAPSFFSQPFWSLLRWLLEGNIQMSSSLAAHLCFLLLHHASLQNLRTLDECQQWLFTERISLFMSSSSSASSRRVGVSLCGTPPTLPSRLRYEFLLSANPHLMWQAVQILQQM